MPEAHSVNGSAHPREATTVRSTTPGSLADQAGALARKHEGLRQPDVIVNLLDRLPVYDDLLAAIRDELASAEIQSATVQHAAEWLLDNYYIIQQALRQIRQDMPAGYYRQLPTLGRTGLEGYPRVYAIAQQILTMDGYRLDMQHAQEFVEAYQENAPLTMGELWAIPTMLRLCAIEVLTRTFAPLARMPLSADATTPGVELPDGPVDAGAGACILSLRALAEEDWEEFFESVSLVERELRQDPAGIYAAMDFDTRDRYRQAIEGLALSTKQEELAVTEQALALSHDAGAGDGVAKQRDSQTETELPHESDARRHVGYYLIADGRDRLEKSLGFSPRGRMRLHRIFSRRPTVAYLGSITLLTLLLLSVAVLYASRSEGTALQLVGAGLLALVPVLTLSVGLVNWAATMAVPPRILPKLDFREGISPGHDTMVVIPTLITSPREVESLLQQIELHFLRNPDPGLRFALLTDYGDADEHETPEDAGLLAQAETGIRELNARYGRKEDGSAPSHNGAAVQPFYLFHRARRWNHAEARWMGWERKRGKLEELNRLILGSGTTTFVRQVGDLDALRHIRYVITLDADTVLPPGSAARLVGTLAHPLNCAVFDLAGETVVSGYTVLQPRTEVALTGANRSLFSRVFAGDTGLDLYTRAVSDVYQDLFGEGNYVGKGIYEVAPFARSLDGRVPENSLLSHDLFEGLQGRAGLVSDIILYEDYPPNYLVYAHRSHRWIRGDWQLLPWLLSVPRPAVSASRNARLSVIDHWKIADNLRRSMLLPSLLALLVAGWTWLPGAPWVWTLVALAALAAPILTGFLGWALQAFRARKSSVALDILPSIQRWLLAVVFLPYEAIIAIDAIGSTLVRMTITRRHLLQWTTAAHSVRLVGREWKLGSAWQKMWTAPLLTMAIIVFTGFVNPAALWIAAPLLLAWLASPVVAWWISRPSRAARKTELSDEQERLLRSLARRTWLYFERFVGPDDNWLPPDHFQEAPLGVVAHRTSPTNIGLALLSSLAAYDLGYVGLHSLVLQLNDAFEGLAKLERYRGHFLNWYDTKSLRPLPPRYVSTVDSGNLAACLIALRQGCIELVHDTIPRPERWEGLLDTLYVLAESTAVFSEIAPELDKAVHRQLEVISDIANAACDHPEEWSHALAQVSTQELPALQEQLAQAIETHGQEVDAAALARMNIWLERAHHHVSTMRRELEHLSPCYVSSVEMPAWLQAIPATSPAWSAWRDLASALPRNASLAIIPGRYRIVQDRLSALAKLLEASHPGVPDEQREVALAWCAAMREKIESCQSLAAALISDIHHLCDRCEKYLREMNFGFLLSAQRKVFHIGYNVDTSRLDRNYYDLLASEARIASLIAIAKGDAPVSHWLQMARPLIAVDGTKGLLSWNGSMFEYLMPILLVKQYENSLLQRSSQATVEQQIEYAREQGVPWGISESGYYRLDRNANYQYRGFGVPGLGLKRGLDEDLVITPYASLLALPLDADAVLSNLKRMASLDMLGTYGFFEAMDFTTARRPAGQRFGRVQSYMSHHQGMILLSLTNQLSNASDGIMVRRFHRDSRIQSVELLLQEQVPQKPPLERLSPEATSTTSARPRIAADSWPVQVDTPYPEAHFISNSRYGVLVTNSGGGFSSYAISQDSADIVDLTRWRADTSLDDWGTRVYILDCDMGFTWPAYGRPLASERHQVDACRVFFAPHKVEFHSRQDEIAVHTEITVSPTEDAELRLIRVTNDSNRRRNLRLTSFAEVALAYHEPDRRHPAFSKLFVESEYQPEINALVFHRRPRSADEPRLFLLHSLVLPPGRELTGAYESDRERFLGRLGTPAAPQALTLDGSWLSGGIGATLDPILALGQEISLEPYETEEIALVTLVGKSRRRVVTAARSYQDWSAITRMQEDALTASERELRDRHFTVPELALYQRLLSLLLFPHSTLRADAATLAANRMGQAGLWPHAISGDYPILLVRVKRQEDTAVVHELLRAHAYWRSRNLKVDLVILNEQAGGYAQGLQGNLLRLITDSHSEAWLERRGGVFLLSSADLGGGEASSAVHTLLLTAARVVLDGAAGSLEQQLKGKPQMPLRLPEFTPARPIDAPDPPLAPPPRPHDLRFDNGTGGFSPDGREYVIYLKPKDGVRRPAIIPTPAPWVNVIANRNFGFLVSESGGGYTWCMNSGENRLTPWRNDPVTDLPGEALYLRDEETGEVWSPTPAPAGEESPYLVRHGAGYTVFEHNSHGLKQQLELFAARDAPAKFIRLRLVNAWRRPRRITATYYAEWVLGTDRETTQPFVISEYDAERGALLARNPYHPEYGRSVAFLAASKPPHGVTADRAEFLGRLGSMNDPAALHRIGLAGTIGPGLDPCAAHQIHIDLAPGGSEEIHFLLGQGSNRDEALALVDLYRDPARAEAVRGEALAFWDELLGAVTVETPEPALDLMLNRWLLYQTLSCRVWGRSALYQSSGAFGFRDQLQDVSALLHAAPAVAREHILRAARQQFPEGDVLHWWHESPVPQGGFPASRGIRTRISDNYLWLPFVVAEYVRSTGDQTSLEEQLPYLAAAPLEPEEHERYALYEVGELTESLYDHCLRAAMHGVETGSHGLPLMGAGDWNDGMNRVGMGGRGESVWLAWFRAATLRALAAMAELRGNDEQAAAFLTEAERLADAVEANAWDGAWYVRAYYDDGQPLGAARDVECAIDSIAQSWAILSGLGDSARARRAMESVYERLVDPAERLIMLFAPPFDKTRRDPGYIKAYPPGIRENGGQYTHAGIWAAWAFAGLGDGDRAGELYRLLNPIFQADTAEKVRRYRVEPYVVAADIGSRAPHIGRGGWSWYTGSAGWLYRLGVEGILGMRREGNVLNIAPCLPDDWTGYEARYRFGESVYHLRVNAEGKNTCRSTDVRVVLDGRALPDARVPLVDDGRQHEVLVRFN